MRLLSAYLLSGLLAHKLLWEVLKGHGRGTTNSEQSIPLLAVRTVKVAILIGILIQTTLPLLASSSLPTEVFPISKGNSTGLHAGGVILFTIGLFTAILGRIQLGHSWSDIELPRAAQERPVVSHGLYSYIRHPIYSGDVLLLLGLELALNSWLVFGAILLMPMVFFRAVKEEKLLAKELSGYDAYVQRTKRFIPFLV